MDLPRTWGRVTCIPSCTSHMGWCPLLWHPELSGSGGNLQVGEGEEMFVEAPSAYWRSHIMPIFRFLFLYPDLSGAAWRMWLWKHVWKKSWYTIRRKGVFCPLFTASCEMLFYPPAKTEVLLNLWQDLKGAEPTPGRLVLLTWDMDCISEPSAGTLKILALNSLQHPLPVRGCNCKAVAIDKMSQTFSQKYLFIFSCFCACWDICDMQNHVTANKHASSQTDKTALGINKLKTSQLVASRAILLAIQYNNMQYFFISLYNSLQKHLLVRYGHDNLSCVEDIRSRKLYLCALSVHVTGRFSQQHQQLNGSQCPCVNVPFVTSRRVDLSCMFPCTLFSKSATSETSAASWAFLRVQRQARDILLLLENVCEMRFV